MVQININKAHQTFPLSRFALSRLNLTPEFDYPNPSLARELNHRLRPPLPAYTPGEITAVGLIGKIFIRAIDQYINSSPLSFQGLDQNLRAQLGEKFTDDTLSLFLSHFPTTKSHFHDGAIKEYMLSSAETPLTRHGLYLSILLIGLAEQNPAIINKDYLFSDPELRSNVLYSNFMDILFGHFDEGPPVGPGTGNLIDFLLEPSKRHPGSFFDQLEFIKNNWSNYLGDDFLIDLLLALDQIKEERLRGLPGRNSDPDPLGYNTPSYQHGDDPVRFSTDLDWMPNVILLAKNVFVWLDQLSKTYQRPIHQLDQIPDRELAKLSDWGITGLWLIGLWQRSSASQKIKQICGNQDAVPSAYSLYDYVIADTLGGEKAYQTLKQKAEKHNIRLAADMVPNHMGIFSKWTLENPDWFLSVNHSPYPSYTFDGPDLSDDKNIGVFIEDHYYDKTDAAVVFRRVDRVGGTEKYLYHGNDGTSTPWNDTAQLDFLNPDVREAVIQNILHVARKFPIIRFDAAMTLAKKHIQRLWFPEPGSGGAIPTRSAYGLSKKDFDERMPEEFWREVVDRVASEAPDTLLLAEAFWMMEGYFVRNLGMHRVYNSAFMHMLRDEDNKKYRDLIIKTLEYDPQILKRYVNFMNNPDEDTAISQFGLDGKYFGVCTMMSTLPGLPMIGHGQIEGLTEKYGMEYQRAYYDEQPNIELIARHKREIFPLLRKRYLFAEVDQFFLFDFTNENGEVDENVLAFTNRKDKENALVIFHNQWAETKGCIFKSTEINDSSSTLIKTLGLFTDDMDFVLFHEHVSGKEYIRKVDELLNRGFHLELGAYQYRVFMNFTPIKDPDGSYQALHDDLGGKGVDSIEYSRIRLKLVPLSTAINTLVERLIPISNSPEISPAQYAKEIKPLVADYSSALAALTQGALSLPPGMEKTIINRLGYLSGGFELTSHHNQNTLLPVVLLWSIFADLLPGPLPPEIKNVFQFLANLPAIQALARSVDPVQIEHGLETWISLFPDLKVTDLKIEDLINVWLNPENVNLYLTTNQYDGKTWFNKESFELLLDLSTIIISKTKLHPSFIAEPEELLPVLIKFRTEISEMMESSDYQIENLGSLLRNYAIEWNSQAAN